MSQQVLILKCHSCQEKQASVAVDKNNPFFEEDDFGISLEWSTKQGAIEKIKNKKCPKCGSDDGYFTDAAEN